MKQRYENLNAQIEQDEKQKVQIERDLKAIQDRLESVKVGLQRKIQKREEYARTITETESAYKKVRTIVQLYFFSMFTAYLLLLLM